jgi:MFS family permease
MRLDINILGTGHRLRKDCGVNMSISRQYAQQLEKGNFHHLVMDIFWFGLALPATSRFIAVYAMRVGATAQEIGWMASMPALLLLLSTQVSDWWRRRYPDATHAVLAPALGFRFAFLLPALTPLVPAHWQPLWLILAVSLPALPQGVSTVMFLVMMREAVSLEQITTLMSRRHLAMNVSLAISTAALGIWLARIPFPNNYQVMFLLAFGLTLISLWHVKKTEKVYDMTLPVRRLSAREIWRDLSFRQAVNVIVIVHLAFFFVAPLIPVYLVENLGADEQFVAVFVFVELTAGASTAACVPWVAGKIGHRALLPPSLMGMAASTLVIALAPNLTTTLIGAFLNGAFWTVSGVAMFAYFSENAPSDRVAGYTKFYNQAVFASVFIAPLLSSSLVDRYLGLAEVLLLGAALRLGAAFLIQFGLKSSLNARHSKVRVA